MSASKTILVAHRQPAVRDRFAAALADARHHYVLADSAEALTAAAGDDVSLVLFDAGLTDDPPALVEAIRGAAARARPVVVFAGTVSSADVVRALAAMGVSAYVNEFAATAQILPALAPYLFPANFDRRASRRVPIGVPVSYRAGQTIAGALTLDVGKGGIGIRTMSPLGPGTPIHVRFTLPSSGDVIEASGSVAWSDSRLGMGIRFDEIGPAAQLAVDRFVDERG